MFKDFCVIAKKGLLELVDKLNWFCLINKLSN